MKILVTGGRGFIGTHLIPALKKKGHTVRSYDIKDGQDILDAKQLSKAIKWADVVYHLAALTDVQESIRYPKKYKRVNHGGTSIVFYMCDDYGKKVIFTSTAAIYHEKSSPYAQSKKDAERPLTFSLACVIFRLFNVYGEGMNKSTMLSRFQNENPITVYGDGKQTRDFIHIDDVVKILVDALKSKWNGFIGDVGTGRSLTVLSIAKQFKKQIIYKEKRQEVNTSTADTTELHKLYSKSFQKLEDYICKLLS